MLFSRSRLLPLSAYDASLKPGYFVRLEQRTTAAALGRDHIQASLSAIDECLRELPDQVRAISCHLAKYAETVTAELSELREFLVSALREAEVAVQTSMFEDEPTLRCRLAKYLREFHRGAPPLFRYALSKELFPKDLDSLCSYHVDEGCWTEGFSTLVAGLRPGAIQVLNLSTGGVQECPIKAQVNEGTVCCFTDEQTLLCLGAYPPSASAFTVSLSGTVTSRQPQLHSRGFAGVLKHSEQVYVFGGHSHTEAMRHCEKYMLDRDCWLALDDMRDAKCAFMPCRSRGFVFLPDVRASGDEDLEVFVLASEQFRVVKVDRADLLGWSVAFVVSDELVVVTSSGQKGRWRRGEPSFRVTDITVEPARTQATSPPVLSGWKTYWAENSEFFAFDLRTSEVTRLGVEWANDGV